MDDEYTTATFQESRFSHGGQLKNLLGAKGKTAQIIQNLGRDELGNVGLAGDELREKLNRFRLTYPFSVAEIEKIVANMKEMENLGYMNMATLAAVIVFLHISGLASQKQIALNQSYFKGKNNPFDAVYPNLKSIYESDHEKLGKTQKEEFKETFLRYINTLVQAFPKDLSQRI